MIFDAGDDVLGQVGYDDVALYGGGGLGELGATVCGTGLCPVGNSCYGVGETFWLNGYVYVVQSGCNFAWTGACQPGYCLRNGLCYKVGDFAPPDDSRGTPGCYIWPDCSCRAGPYVSSCPAGSYLNTATDTCTPHCPGGFWLDPVSGTCKDASWALLETQCQARCAALGLSRGIMNTAFPGQCACCPAGTDLDPVTNQCVRVCPVGQYADASGVCRVACPAGYTPGASGTCVLCPTCATPKSCPAGTYLNTATQTCTPLCPAGSYLTTAGSCFTPPPCPTCKTCPSGTYLNTATGLCVSPSCPTCKSCPPGQYLDTASQTCFTPPVCETCQGPVPCPECPSCAGGQVWDFVTQACVDPVTCPPPPADTDKLWFWGMLGGVGAVTALVMIGKAWLVTP